MSASSIPVRIACLAGLLAFLSACATLRTDVPRPVSNALPPTVQSPLAREAQRQAQAHPGQSGFRVLSGNTDALMSRIVLADHAARSIDLQYYIFADDATGRLLAQRLLAAADRGVRVRLLLDDLDVIEQDPLLDALDAHPNIEVRLFNPFRVRNRSLWSKALQFTVDGARLNRRMHNKSFTVDNLFTVVGGRNIGDAYFDAGNEIHFRDLDVLAIGPVVEQTSDVFDRYWNSDAAFPVTAYDVHHATARNLSRTRTTLQGAAREFAESDYAQAMLDALPDGSSADRSGRWDWGAARVVADDPAKVEPGEKRRALLLTHDLRAMLDVATTNVQIVSPYFIPGRNGVEYLHTLAARGVKVSVLTNSLAATDEAAVHAGYARYRRALLAGGVELYELRPLGGAPPIERARHVFGHQPARQDAGGRRARSVRRLDEHGSALAAAQHGDGRDRRLARAGAPDHAVLRQCDAAGERIQGRAGAARRPVRGAGADALERALRRPHGRVRPRPGNLGGAPRARGADAPAADREPAVGHARGSLHAGRRRAIDAVAAVGTARAVAGTRRRRDRRRRAVGRIHGAA